MTGALAVAMLEQAVIDAEHAHGLVPADATRPTFPWERHVNFADIDRTLTVGYQATAQALAELRQAIMDGLTEALGGAADPVKVAQALRAFAATQPPAIRRAIAAAVDDIARSLAEVHNRAGELLIAEARRQARTPRAPLSKTAPAVYTEAAQVGPAIMWQRITAAATEAAVPRATAQDVTRAAEQVSPKKAEDLARQQINVAHGQGRTAALAELPEPKRVYASELLDSRTCPACAAVDGREYDSMESALVDYPQAGPYRSCLGGTRCRGTLVYVWSEDEPRDGIPEPQGPATAPAAQTVIDRLPLADPRTVRPNLAALTGEQVRAVKTYTADPGLIDQVMRGAAPITAAIAAEIGLIRSAIARHPLPDTIRVTRETDAADLGLTAAAEAPHIPTLTEFAELGFLTAQVLADPRASAARHDPVILDLLLPAGTPALRITGTLLPGGGDPGLLLVDARVLTVIDVVWDDHRRRWRIRALVSGRPQ